MMLLSHPTGNTFVRASGRALHRRGWLYAFCTTVVAPKSLVVRFMPRAVRRQALRRRFPEIPRSVIRTFPWRECVRLGATALGAEALTRAGSWASVDAVYQALDEQVSRLVPTLPPWVKGVYAYEDGAEHTFRAARSRGLGCLYELPIAHWRTTQRLLREEAERLPAWRPTLRGIDDPPAKLERKDREIEFADAVMVPSRFVLDSLPAEIRASKPCVVAPFGSPRVVADQEYRQQSTDRPLRVLFAGALTQRKGLADLFAAMRLLKRSDIELVVMGTPLAPLSFYWREYPGFTYEPPRPHAEVLAVMRSCDVLVLPTLVEGRALVQQEALACGLPIVVTANAGGEDLVDEGRTGFLVPIRSPQVIAEKLAMLADDRTALEAMRAHARRKAAGATWSDYEARVISAAQLVIGHGDDSQTLSGIGR